MNIEEIRQKCIDYLIDSGFVAAYTKKSVYPSDVAELYDDYLGEVWLAILELPAEKIASLYTNSVTSDDPDDNYQLRNYISMLIRNVCHSDSSNAYKKLKRHSKRELIKTPVQWDCYQNTIPDGTIIEEKLRELD